MNDDLTRPNPDELLERIKAEDQQNARGKLKIFLGYVAGVGKTYAMLEAAHQRKNEGVDVVVGYAETHKRKETEALLEGLEIIPRLPVQYKGTTLYEMDLDAVINRRPKLVLVDELAHTNAPGSRHPKRYMDVEEILNAGIDVYSTINIQHLESLNDVVQQITGVVVRETIPDKIVDETAEIELIDLPTDELLQRLKDGKVYLTDQAVRALEKFFRKGNLTALRELSMRRAADRIDNQMLDYMQTKSIQGPWPAGERILVCLSSHPLGERLIRTGRRLADDLKAEWHVMFVETPGHMKMPAENRARIEQNLRLAEEIGAKVIHITDESVARVVIDYAHEHNITKIIAGKPRRPRWFELIRGSVIDQIIRNSGKIDVYVVSEETETQKPNLPLTITPHRPLGRYFWGFCLVILMTVIGFPLQRFIDPTNLVMLYLIAVIISALSLGRGPAILTSITSVLAFDYFFVDPRFSFSVKDSQYLLTFLGLLIVGLIISNSAALLRDQVDVLRVKERQTQAISNLSRDLTGAISLEQVMEMVIRNIEEIFHRDSVILLSDGEKLVEQAFSPGFVINEKERAVAEWTYKNRQPAGWGTTTLSAATIHYMPLLTARGVIGVLGVKPPDSAKMTTLEQRNLLESIANLSALAIERASFAVKAAQSEMLRNTEKLQTALLNSISHEFRTPLASITGVLTSLGESLRTDKSDRRFSPATSIELVDSATRQAHQLNRLVQNLLDMTRLEAGAIHLNRELLDIQELIGSVLYQNKDRYCDHPVHLDIEPDLPFISADAILIAQVLTNLLDNACKYSDPGMEIQINAKSGNDVIEISVQDHGIGVPEKDLEKIFDKFFRVDRHNAVTGTGLGLSICKGIVEAHNGKIWAMNSPDHGLMVTFSLPVKSG